MQSDMERIAALDFEPHLKCEIEGCDAVGTTAIRCRHCGVLLLLICERDAARAKRFTAPQGQRATRCTSCNYITPRGVSPIRFEVIA